MRSSLSHREVSPGSGRAAPHARNRTSLLPHALQTHRHVLRRAALSMRSTRQASSKEFRRLRSFQFALPGTASCPRYDLEFGAAVECPRFFSVSLHRRPLLTESDDSDAIFTDSERSEITLCFGSAAKAERKVVFIRSALISVSGNANAHIRMTEKNGSFCFERAP